jgi:predicted CopG family antitoxin
MITEKTYDTLKNLGTVTESFNDIIWKLIQNEKKAVSGQQPFNGSASQDTAGPLQPGGGDG